MGFELGSLEPQAGVLPIEPPLLVEILPKAIFKNLVNIFDALVLKDS